MANKLTEMLAQFGGLDTIAEQLNAPKSDVTQGADAMLPAILGGFKNLLQKDGSTTGLADIAKGLFSATGGLQGLLGQQTNAQDQGNQILSRIFGSSEVSRTVAQSAAKQTGLDLGFLLKLLPLLASLVGQFASGQSSAKAQSGGAAGLIGGLLGRVAGGAQQDTSDDAVGGGLQALLKLAGDGNALNDILSASSQT